MSTVEQLAAEQGFDFMGTCSAKELVARPEVRAMCAAGKCQVYGHSWACPPACGEIEDFERQMHEFEHCLVVQTVTEMEDDFDVEAIEEGGEPETMTLSAGTCTLCKECTYPDEPCRFPDKRLVSMEAAGLVVSEVCLQAGIPYNHGPQTIAFSGCVLYN